MEKKEGVSELIKNSTDLLKNTGTKALEISLLSPNNELQSSRKIIKSLKAKANAKRTFFEKFADLSTSVAGSFAFLTINFIWFLGWVLINTNFIPGINAFDPFPFGLLTMIVSLEAIILAILVLISQNRASRIDDIREEIDLQVNVTAEQEITKILTLLTILLKKNGVDLSSDKSLAEMLKPINTNKLEKALEKEIAD
jgi:uncharacterized membrane protein